MRVNRETADQHREEIVKAAGVLFREKGFDGVGIADIMKAAGLTHGGFYGNFASKDNLAAEACSATIARSHAKWEAIIDGASGSALEALVDSYLSPANYAQRGSGCAYTALAADAPRKGKAVRGVFTDGLKPFFSMLAGVLPGRSSAAKRRKSMAIMAQLVGAVVLARAVNDTGLAQEILAASAQDILQT